MEANQNMPSAEQGSGGVTGSAPVTASLLHQHDREAFQSHMAEFVKSGKFTQEQADQYLKAEGIESVAPTVSTDPAVQEMDQVFPQARAEDFQMPQLSDEYGNSTPHLKEADRQSRTWLAEAGFTKEIGSHMARIVNDNAEKYEKLSPAERDLFKREQTVQLEKMWGADFKKNSDLAEEFVQELERKQPGLAHVLKESGSAHSAEFIMRLHQQAERQRLRRGGK